MTTSCPDKDQILRWHKLLAQTRIAIATPDDQDAFREYDTLGVQWTHIWRAKGEHVQAIDLLTQALTQALASLTRTTDDTVEDLLIPAGGTNRRG